MLLKFLLMGALALGQAVAADYCPDFDEVWCGTEDGSLAVNIKRTINPDGAEVYTFASDDVIVTLKGNVRLSGRFVVGEGNASCSALRTGLTFSVYMPILPPAPTPPSEPALYSISVTEGPVWPSGHGRVEMSVQYWTAAEAPHSFGPQGFKKLSSCVRI